MSKMQTVKLSFVIPVYQTPLEKIEKCMESICALDGIAYEMVVINDGSDCVLTDALEQYLQTFETGKVVYFHQENAGVSAARNKGLELAGGEYVMFLDADDTILADNLHPQDLTAGDVLIYNNVMHKNGSSSVIRGNVTLSEGEQDKEQALAYLLDMTGLAALIYRMEMLKGNNIQFDTRMVHGEDFVFRAQSMLNAEKIYYFDRPLYSYQYSIRSIDNRWHRKPSEMLHDIETVYRMKQELSAQIAENNRYGHSIEEKMNRFFVGDLFVGASICSGDRELQKYIAQIRSTAGQYRPKHMKVQTWCKYLSLRLGMVSIFRLLSKIRGVVNS